MASILIIDDDRLVRESARILLQSRGHDVEVAADGRAGIDAVEVGSFDLAIVDLFMNGIDGLQVMKAIRRIKPGFPMIAASGFMFNGDCPQMPEFEAMAVEAGASSTLYKPLRPHEVLCAVERMVAANGVTRRP
jgi:CheY-like chemotaxis protein